jgi:hypothetical protein
MGVVAGQHVGKGLSELLDIQRIVECEFRIAIDEPVTAKVKFLLDGDRVNRLLELFEDGEWRVRQ